MTPEDILAQQKAVVDESLTWLCPPTKYLHGELVKNCAADCASFIAATFNNAIGTQLVVEKYVEQWYLNGAAQLYLDSLRAQGFVEIPRERVQPADLVIAQPHCDRYSHGGIVLAWPKPASVIHCSRRGVERVHSMWATWYFGQRTHTHLFFRWGAWV